MMKYRKEKVKQIMATKSHVVWKSYLLVIVAPNIGPIIYPKPRNMLNKPDEISFI